MVVVTLAVVAFFVVVVVVVVVEVVLRTLGCAVAVEPAGIEDINHVIWLREKKIGKVIQAHPQSNHMIHVDFPLHPCVWFATLLSLPSSTTTDFGHNYHLNNNGNDHNNNHNDLNPTVSPPQFFFIYFLNALLDGSTSRSSRRVTSRATGKFFLLFLCLLH